MAQRSTFTTACVRYWKKLIKRPRESRGGFDLSADIHQYLVEQHQRREIVLLRL